MRAQGGDGDVGLDIGWVHTWRETELLLKHPGPHSPSLLDLLPGGDHDRVPLHANIKVLRSANKLIIFLHGITRLKTNHAKMLLKHSCPREMH